jgi:hypothetical protein
MDGDVAGAAFSDLMVCRTKSNSVAPEARGGSHHWTMKCRSMRHLQGFKSAPIFTAFGTYIRISYTPEM